VTIISFPLVCKADGLKDFQPKLLMPWAVKVRVLRKEQELEGNESLLFRKTALESEGGMKRL